MHTQAQQLALLQQAQNICTKAVNMYNASTYTSTQALLQQFTNSITHTNTVVIASVITIYLNNNNIVAYYDEEQMYAFIIA